MSSMTGRTIVREVYQVSTSTATSWVTASTISASRLSYSARARLTGVREVITAPRTWPSTSTGMATNRRRLVRRLIEVSGGVGLSEWRSRTSLTYSPSSARATSVRWASDSPTPPRELATTTPR